MVLDVAKTFMNACEYISVYVCVYKYIGSGCVHLFTYCGYVGAHGKRIKARIWQAQLIFGCWRQCLS